ncbi:putative amidase C869.01 [Vitis vinifera]|uniref:Putative amidase C869.01 n=1 Tax=Vitis vinifera TaxID=29760 RepID=A0A438IIM4_VITVI|nr:putative amidase C869.01 [Vitis vinifera]
MKSKTKVGELNGIPVLLKDSINTKDMLNSIAGSYALLGVEVSGDATVVKKLRNAGALILGKASMNPYGSSSGSAISVASNMVAVSLGTETNGSIICPADHNSVIGFKPTVGLTSRAGVIPISPRQDSVGPICSVDVSRPRDPRCCQVDARFQPKMSFDSIDPTKDVRWFYPLYNVRSSAPLFNGGKDFLAVMMSSRRRNVGCDRLSGMTQQGLLLAVNDSDNISG